VQAAQAVIKTRREQDGVTADLYLMQYDLHARRYQPIGGKREPSDGDMMDTLRREIGEELGLGYSPGADACKLTQLGDGWMEKTLSATYGILTEYTFSFFQVTGIRFPVATDDMTHWLTRAEVFAGRAIDGRTITSIYQQALGWDLLDELAPASFH
jgi:8-oxo-dGTP pyrophosphatase MutT (NUDIX family)